MKDFLCAAAGLLIAYPFFPNVNNDYATAFYFIITATVIATVLSLIVDIRNN